MSQDWKVRNVLIQMHGNNGSVDGDPPAAMRYTEARLSAIAAELLRDIEKDTVEFIPNFDDTSKEPTVLPAMFPNLLVNGSTGISAGYATDIPPHHLGEVIDGVIMKMDKPDITVDELMTVIKGPDFPTGGIIQGIEGIKKPMKLVKVKSLSAVKQKSKKFAAVSSKLSLRKFLMKLIRLISSRRWMSSESIEKLKECQRFVMRLTELA